jgi:hypothetical protein
MVQRSPASFTQPASGGLTQPAAAARQVGSCQPGAAASSQDVGHGDDLLDLLETTYNAPEPSPRQQRELAIGSLLGSAAFRGASREGMVGIRGDLLRAADRSSRSRSRGPCTSSSESASRAREDAKFRADFEAALSYLERLHHPDISLHCDIIVHNEIGWFFSPDEVYAIKARAEDIAELDICFYIGICWSCKKRWEEDSYAHTKKWTKMCVLAVGDGPAIAKLECDVLELLRNVHDGCTNTARGGGRCCPRGVPSFLYCVSKMRR